MDAKNWVWVPDDDQVFVRGYLSGNNLVTTVKGAQESTTTYDLDQIQPCNPVKFNKCDDMAELTHLNEPSVIYNLQLRYDDDLIYTYSGLFLVAINPYKLLPIYDATVLNRFHNQQYDKPPPHIFAVAENTYRNLLTNKKDQSILVTGESGAGKTENTKKIIQYLSLITPSDIKSGDRHNSIDTKILQANPILESFGNAKTIKNNNSSRFGKFIRIFFDQGVIDGATIEYYLLEKSRVVHQLDQERNYHVFYQFLKGQSDAKLKSFELSKDVKSHAYLRNSRSEIPNVDDVREFNSLVDAFDIMGFSEFESNNIFSILAIILHLGNLEFSSWKSEQASFTKTSPVAAVARLLGIKEDDLATNLLRPKVKAGREFVSKSRKAPEVKYVIDAFAKHLYERVFQYIITRINDNLRTDVFDDSLKSIGVLDIAGFEIFDVNSFEQLCINYTNEKLQQFFNHHSFILEQSEYLRENIQWEFIDFGQDLQPTIDLIEQRKPMGVLEILNEECMMPKSSDKSFMEKLAQNWDGKSVKFKQNKYKSGFIINHYAGVVEYNVDNWLQKNTDPVSDNLLALLPNSTNEFIQSLFVPEEVQSSPKKGSRQKKTTSQKHKEQLNDLMDQLGLTEPHFVRCILPNLNKKPNGFDKRLVLHQLRCNGVLEGIRITRAGYPNKVHFEEFFTRYSILNSDNVFTKNMKTNCELILKNLGLSKDAYRVGITKIFFKNGILGQLEDLRELSLKNIFTVLQSVIRARNARRSFKQRITEIQASSLVAKNLQQLDLLLLTNGWFKLFVNIKPLLEESVKVLDSKEVNENLKKINGKLKDTENAKAHLEGENKTLKESLSKLEDEIIATNNLMKEKASKLDKLVHEEKNASKKVAELERQLSEIKALNTKLAREKVEFDERLRQSDERVQTNTKENSELSQQYAASVNRIKQLELQIKGFDSVKSKHESIIGSLKREFESSKKISASEATRLKEANQSLSTQVNELQSYKAKVAEIESQLRESERNLVAAKRENESLKKEVAKVTAAVAGYKEKERALSEEKAQQQELTREVKDLKRALQEQEAETSQVLAQYAKLKKDFEDNLSVKLQLSNQINDLKHQVASAGRSNKENVDPDFVEEFANIKLKLNESAAALRREKLENKKLMEEVNILKSRLKKNNLNTSVSGLPVRRSVAMGEEIMYKKSNDEIELLKMRLEQEEANAIRAENYAIELQKKLNMVQSTRGLNTFTDYEKKYKESQARINELERRYEKMIESAPSSRSNSVSDLSSSGGRLSRSDSFGFNLNGSQQDFVKIYQDITKTLRSTREELNTSKMEILRLKSLLRESEEELYEVKRNNFKTSVNDYEDELAQLRVRHDTLSVKNNDLSKQVDLYKKRAEENYRKLELAESAISISKRHEEQINGEYREMKNELHLLREEQKTSLILVKDLRREVHTKEELINDKQFEIQQLKSSITNLEEKLGYINKNYGDNKELEDKYKDDIRNLNKELDFKLETETKLVKENKQLQLDLEEMTQAESELRAAYEEIFDKNETLLVENSELTSKLRLLEGEHVISERKNSNLGRQISALKSLNEEVIKQKEELLAVKEELSEQLELKGNECEHLAHELAKSQSNCKLLRDHLDNQRLESKEIQNELNRSKLMSRSETQDYLKVLKDKLVIKEENDSLKKINKELNAKIDTLEDKLYSNEQLKFWENKVNSLTGDLDDAHTTQHEQLKKINALERTVKTLEIRIANEAQLTKKYNDENFNYQNQVGHYKSTIDILHGENEEKELQLKANERELLELREAMLMMEQENLQMKERLGL